MPNTYFFSRTVSYLVFSHAHMYTFYHTCYWYLYTWWGRDILQYRYFRAVGMTNICTMGVFVQLVMMFVRGCFCVVRISNSCTMSILMQWCWELYARWVYSSNMSGYFVPIHFMRFEDLDHTARMCHSFYAESRKMLTNWHWRLEVEMYTRFQALEVTFFIFIIVTWFRQYCIYFKSLYLALISNLVLSDTSSRVVCFSVLLL